MDEKNLAILAKLKQELMEEQGIEIIYPFKTSSSSTPAQAPQKQISKPKKHKKRKKKQPQMEAPPTRPQEDFATRNRRMVATHSNISRSYSSADPFQSLYTYSGGMVRPK